MRLFFTSCLMMLLSSVASVQAADPFADLSNIMRSSNVMTVDNAFQLNAFEDSGQIHANFVIAPDMKLYQHKLSITSDSANLGEFTLPPADDYVDPEFGDVKVYHEMLSLEVPIMSSAPGDVVTIKYQGCSLSLCYPPVEKTLVLNQHILLASPTLGNEMLNDTKVANDDESVSDWGVLVFFALGLGLALTPCVFPMYPIMSSVVIGQGKKTTGQILALSFSYVQGMALVYSSMGILVALAGVKFQIAMQQPWVMMFVCGLFVLLALSMFGAFTIQLPSRYSNKLNEANQKTQGGSIFGSFAIGALSGLVASPCTTAPLAGILVYVAQSGDVSNGFLSLYALTMGMGVPLILFSITSGKLMPKAGNWMNYVKHGFGFMLLGVAVYFSSRFLDDLWVSLLYCALALGLLTYIQHKNNSSAHSAKRSVIQLLTTLAIVITANVAVWQWQEANAPYSIEQPEHALFEQVDSMDDYQAKLTQARANGQTVMLDLYADWCSACIQYEKNTFPDNAVQASLEGVKLLQIDMSTNTEFGNAIQKEMGVVGLPTIMFLDGNGNELPSSRVTGYLDAEDFTEHITSSKVTSTCMTC
jgi:thiol:disulfide interchange protein DsbD